MEKKFSKVAADENNPNWSKLIQRENELYEKRDDIRSPFARDYTRVLHSLAYRRLKHKTQVFFNAAGNDHICTRIEHVSHVDSVSSTIAKYLGLNEELTKAIATAHDLGHAPFGHQGETILNDLTTEHLNKNFWHEQNGLYFVEKIELLEDNQRNLKNLDLTYAVRDGIISHCGELNQNSIRPRKECISLSDFNEKGKYESVTWEGCVVKLSDKIAYLGRDIEDAIRLGYLNVEQKEILRELARKNEESAVNTTVIMHNMILDLCHNSSIDNGLCLSKEMSDNLNMIKKFNETYIYSNDRLNTYKKYSNLVIHEIFDKLLSYYDGDKTFTVLSKEETGKKQFVYDFANWLVQYCANDFTKISWAAKISERCLNQKIYQNLERRELYIQAIIDYISGMTDVYAIRAFNELLEC